MYGLQTEHFGPFTQAVLDAMITAPLLRAVTLYQGEIMSHLVNIKFPWALVLLQNEQCERLCVDWICPPNKSSVFNSLLYVLLTAKWLLYGHQSYKQLGWGTVPRPTCFSWGDTLQFNCSRWSESNNNKVARPLWDQAIFSSLP